MFALARRGAELLFVSATSYVRPRLGVFAMSVADAASIAAAVFAFLTILASFEIDRRQKKRSASAEDRAERREAESRRLADERAAEAEKSADARVRDAELRARHERNSAYNNALLLLIEYGRQAQEVLRTEAQRPNSAPAIGAVTSAILHISEQIHAAGENAAFSPLAKVATKCLAQAVDAFSTGMSSYALPDWKKELSFHITQIDAAINLLLGERLGT